MNTHAHPTPYTHVGDASTEHAFLTNAEGYDVAFLRRIEPSGWPDLQPENYMTDEQWQRTINLVNAAPKLLAACIELVKHIETLPDDTEKCRILRLALNNRAGEQVKEAINKATA